MSGATLAFDIIAKDRASGTFDKIGRSSSSAGDKVKALAKGGALALGGLAVAGGAIAGKFMVDAVKGWQDHLKVSAQTSAVLKSTGAVAGVTRKQVESLANSIERKTGVDGDAIQSGQNLLLTFTNLQNRAGKGNDIFNQTTQLMTDMSVAMGQSTKASAIQLGKALNDPVKGVSALSKVGVTFTDQQKEQIKVMQDAGDTAGAQKVILAELGKEFGGSAAAQMTAGDKLRVVYNQISDSVGQRLLPIFNSLATWAVDKGLPAMQRLGGWLGDTFGPIIGKLVGWFKTDLLPALKSVWEKALPGLRSAFDSVKKALSSAQPYFKLLGDILAHVILPVLGKVASVALPLVGKALEIVGKYLGTAAGVIKKVASAFLILGEYGVKAFRFLLTAAFATFEGILMAADKGLGWVPGLGGKIHAAREAFTEFGDKTIEKLKGVEDSLHRTRDAIDGLKSKTIHIDVIETHTRNGVVTHSTAGGHTPYLQTGQGPI